jgi:hypothetical protein
VVLLGKTEGKRSLGSPRRSCEDNIKMYLKNTVESCGILPQDKDRRRALVSTGTNLQVL